MLAIIPARGGSKGIPRKNIKPLGGRPLVSYVIKTALACPKIRQVVVSTEDEEIASVARDCGAEVPFLRPMELATDFAPNGSACLHVVDQLAERDGGMVSEFVLIQPTSPFLQVSELTAGIELYKQSNATAVVAVSAHETPIEAVFEQTEDGCIVPVLTKRYGQDFEPTQRQNYGKRFVVNGAFVAVRTDLMRKDPNYYYTAKGVLPLLTSTESGVDIDTPLDFSFAEFLLERRLRAHHEDQAASGGE